MADQREDEQKEKIKIILWQMLLNVMKSLKFLLGVFLKFIIGQAFIYFIKATEKSFEGSHFEFWGFDVHKIAKIFELTVLVTFFFMAMVQDLRELLEKPITWLVGKLKGKKQ